jgi:hypothetical protein
VLAGRRFRRRGFLASLSALVLGAGVLVGANVVAADSVQVQSYERASQEAECPNQPGETPWQADWGPDSSWTPSWEQWANNGTGGWTCTRTIVWAKSSGSGSSSVTYNVGDIGPGGGLVFLISAGKTYEMAPKNWGVNETTPIAWCNVTNSNVATGTAIGTGSANTTAMQPPACTSGAGVSARAYGGGGFTDWFLPSKDELNAMCNYSRNPSAPAAPTVNCFGAAGSTQDATFQAGAYGFVENDYWSSSQSSATDASRQQFRDGFVGNDGKGNPLRVRPIRSF